MSSGLASAIRPSLRDRDRQLSGSPHTPPFRHISSVHSSPGSGLFRSEEDPIIIELDPRYLCVGFQGESGPQCCLRFTPETNRRVGDFRSYLPGFKRRREDVKAKCSEYELWRADIRDVDLGLLEDILERAIREAYNKYLLVDAGSTRLILVLPSLMPLPVLDTVLTLLFGKWKYPSITLLPAPAMTVISAGMRSGLVVDIGWEETVVTAVYEYREVHVRRSTRAMRLLVCKVADFLESVRREQDESIRDALRLDFEFVEEFILRAGVCHALVPTEEEELARKTSSIELGTPEVKSEEEEDIPTTLQIDWPADNSSRPVSILRSALHNICLETLLGSKDNEYPDDHEQPIHLLVYNSLLSVSSDVRSICMSRIVFSGKQASSIRGLSQQVLRSANDLMNQHGWTAVRGKNFNSMRRGLVEMAQGRATPADARYHTALPTAGVPGEEQLLRQKTKPTVTTTFRQVESLGPWAAASLISSFKVRSLVEIDRERFFAHGLAGAHRDIDHSTVLPRTTTKAGEKVNWTLAGWG
ncbi:uncharacterized protein A1O9_02430 [Exophiala aquamarina CBS 119918]|uniref:Uncharacterized protein n=1 Tax=Exophiala aquamarina CBS 119918 TaxID=1182545 RepID=A0A072PNG7_9EURO|nr:uncharacterized protein A1O9_02430 [Exophiala aquamarina CBS 119918]KEF60868.1 hypothetical protein A1O9_02430 [Exophiala aquamarina CBS 119918]